MSTATKHIDPEGVVRSPCVGICALNEDDLCIGCFRTGMEICRWGDMSNEEKRAVLRNVSERERAAYP
ncbi:MAG: DUF1289 domain-containing protein [Hahellaceae bacterium]|nr:DUF1289 domain-containing protein [Hahellaceae bacterium]